MKPLAPINKSEQLRLSLWATSIFNGWFMMIQEPIDEGNIINQIGLTKLI